MNVGNIKKAVAAYLQQSTSSLEVDGQDLILLELNAARRQAELFSNFSEALVHAYVTISSSSGVSLSTAKLVSDNSAVTIRAVDTYYLYDSDSGGEIPLYHDTYAGFSRKEKWKLGKQVWDYDTRFKSDGQRGTTSNNPTVLVRGQQVFLDPVPTSSKTLRMLAYKWFDDYTGDSDTDFFTNYGPEYLKWAAICALNYRLKVFVPRQEGNLSAPEKMRDAALQILISNDIHAQEDGRQPYAHR